MQSMPSRLDSAGDVGACLGTVDAPSTGGSAEVWFAWVGDHAHDVDRYSRDYLSQFERSRLSEYRGREAAERYVVTRSLVRIVLGGRLGVAPRDVEVSRTDMGKPIVAARAHFNVSHSGDLILLALSADRPVGVDVERRRDVSRVPALSQRWLTHAERGDFERLRSNGMPESDAFLRVWSLKEAQLKALGVGIRGAASARLQDVDVLPLDHLLDALSGPHVGSGYVGALAFA
jgi:4'-phosphopantetheinyl transferase